MQDVLEIRQASWGELEILEKYLLPDKIPDFHKNMLRDQDKGRNVWLIAWKGEIPVGHVQVRFGGSENPFVQERLGEAMPIIGALGVKEGYRRKGIATRITQKALEIARERGYKKIGLEVGSTDNPYARALYEKLGFKDWGNGEFIDSWKVVDEKGNKGKQEEICIFMIKEL